MSQSVSARLYRFLAELPVIGRPVRLPARLAKAIVRREVERTVNEKLDAAVGSLSNIHDRLAVSEAAILGVKRSLRQPVPAAGPVPTGSNRQVPVSANVTGPVRLETGLERHGRKHYSQNDEDGIIEYIFSRVGVTSGYFVEFGVGPAGGHTIEESGLECNCRLLLEKGWHGLFMDGQPYPEDLQVKNERITALNINSLFDKYNVPMEFDLLSIDLDGQDFWIWMTLRNSPRLVIVEYNPSLHIDQSCVMPLDVSYVWDGTQYYGASLLALHKLGLDKGYTLLYANGVNAIFLRTDLLSNAGDFKYEEIYSYRGRLLYHRADKLDRAYVRV